MLESTELKLQSIASRTANLIFATPDEKYNPITVEQIIIEAFKETFENAENDWIEKCARNEDIIYLELEVKELQEKLKEEEEQHRKWWERALDNKECSNSFLALKEGMDKTIEERATRYMERQCDEHGYEEVYVQKAIYNAYGNGAAEQEAIMKLKKE